MVGVTGSDALSLPGASFGSRENQQHYLSADTEKIVSLASRLVDETPVPLLFTVFPVCVSGKPDVAEMAFSVEVVCSS